jgi:hypothetical protein
MTSARRLAAILAADVVGYSRLMGQTKLHRESSGPGANAAQPIVAGHGGRIVKTVTACCWTFPPLSLPSNMRRVHRSMRPPPTSGQCELI